MGGSWCQRCTDEYHAWPAAAQKFPSGLFPGCVDADTGRALLLFGLENNGSWCHPQGNADPGDRDNVMAACRETAEETCFGLGAPRHLKVSYFDAGKATMLFGGAWLIDMGKLSAAEQQAILRLHLANKSGGLWREPHHCEIEMDELRWCDAQEFLAALEGHKGDTCITVPSLGAPFRSWATKYYLGLTRSFPFRAFCKQEGWEGAEWKKWKAEAEKAAADSEKDVVQQLLDAAKGACADAAPWELIFAQLTVAPGLANERSGRSFSLLHHAAYWGHSDVATRLVSDFRADVLLRSKDGETAADVAARRGHASLAEFLASQVQVQLVDSLLQRAKNRGSQEAAWEQIFAQLSESPLLVNERNGRNYALLHHAAYWGQMAAARRLVEDFSADVRLATQSGDTPADVAAKQKHSELAQYLLAKTSP